MQVAALALTAYSGYQSAKMQKNAGKIKQYESEVEAAQIETASAQREADRKEALARAVSSQNSMVGQSGISFEGSPLSILVEDQRREAEGTGRDELMSRLGAGAARTRGKVANMMGKANSRLTLLNTAASISGSIAGMAGGANPSQGGQAPITTGYGRAGSSAQPSMGGTGGGRRWSKGAK